MMNSAEETASAVATRTRERVIAAATTAGEWVRANPLAAGALALAVGAAIGLSVPRTEWEDGAMGETRDRAWQRASRAASNIKDTVTQKMATAAEDLIDESISHAALAPPGDRSGRA